MHRLLTSDHYKLSYRDLDELTLDDCFEMHAVLDAIAAAESFAQARARK